MNRILLALTLLLSIAGSNAAVPGVLLSVSTNGTLIAPTNFFSANSNAFRGTMSGVLSNFDGLVSASEMRLTGDSTGAITFTNSQGAVMTLTMDESQAANTNISFPTSLGAMIGATTKIELYGEGYSTVTNGSVITLYLTNNSTGGYATNVVWPTAGTGIAATTNGLAVSVAASGITTNHMTAETVAALIGGGNPSSSTVLNLYGTGYSAETNGNTITVNLTNGVASALGVQSWNGRSNEVTMISGDVTNALGFLPHTPTETTNAALSATRWAVSTNDTRAVTLTNAIVAQQAKSHNGEWALGASDPGFVFDVERATAKTMGKFGGVYPLYAIANYPIVGFNTYYSSGFKIGKGSTNNYGAAVGLDPVTGRFSIWLAQSNIAGGSTILSESFYIANDGKVTINNFPQLTSATNLLLQSATNVAWINTQSATNSVLTDATNRARLYSLAATNAVLTDATNRAWTATIAATNTVLSDATNRAKIYTDAAVASLPKGVTASGSAVATTNGSGVVNIEVTGTGGDVTTAQLVSSTNILWSTTDARVIGATNSIHAASTNSAKAYTDAVAAALEAGGLTYDPQFGSTILTNISGISGTNQFVFNNQLVSATNLISTADRAYSDAAKLAATNKLATDIAATYATQAGLLSSTNLISTADRAYSDDAKLAATNKLATDIAATYATQSALTSATNLSQTAATNSAKTYADATFATIPQLTSSTNITLASSTNLAKLYADSTFPTITRVNSDTNTIYQAATNTANTRVVGATNGLPRGVTASGSSVASTNASGVVNIHTTTTTGGDVYMAQLVSSTNLLNQHVAATFGSNAVVATKAPTNSPTLYNTTLAGSTVFGSEVDALAVSELEVSGLLSFGAVGNIVFDYKGDPLLNYVTSGTPTATWLVKQAGNGAGWTNVPRSGIVGLETSLTWITNNLGVTHAQLLSSTNLALTDATNRARLYSLAATNKLDTDLRGWVESQNYLGPLPIDVNYGSGILEDNGVSMMSRKSSLDGGGLRFNTRVDFESHFSGFHLVSDGGTWLYRDGTALALASLSGTNILFGPDPGIQKIGVVATGGLIGDGKSVTNVQMSAAVSNANAFVMPTGDAKFGVATVTDGVFEGSGDGLYDIPAAELYGAAHYTVLATGTPQPGYVPTFQSGYTVAWSAPSSGSYDINVDRVVAHVADVNTNILEIAVNPGEVVTVEFFATLKATERWAFKNYRETWFRGATGNMYQSDWSGPHMNDGDVDGVNGGNFQVTHLPSDNKIILTSLTAQNQNARVVIKGTVVRNAGP